MTPAVTIPPALDPLAEALWYVWLQDCIAGMAEHLCDECIDLIISSIPFGALFMYSGKTEDIGNNPDVPVGSVDMRASQFGLHIRFCIAQLFRVLRPGCIAAIHIQQLLTTKVQHGWMGRRDFRGAVVDLFSAGGFDWVGEIVIAKNPQIVASRTGLHSLKFETAAKDGRMLAPYVNDYVMIFKKPGKAAPVPCMYYPKDGNLTGWITQEEWIRDAHGVWTDILETDVLEGYMGAREEGDEKHVCPLQLEVIRRLIKLYTNPGELVLDPFSGIGSTGYVAIEQGRRYRGFELKESYHRQSLRHLAEAEELREPRATPKALDLFSALEATAE